MKDRVTIVEVGARDGLQNEKALLSVDDRVELLGQLVDAGLLFLEGGSFVSPKAIPQMIDSDLVWSGVKSLKADFSFLVPNQKGFEKALEVGVKSVAVFTATSDAFNKKNINMTVDESLVVIRGIVESAKKEKMRVRGYISTAFGCPYEGPQDQGRLIELAEKLFKFGCDEVSIGDTIGVGHPQQVKKLLNSAKSSLPMARLAMHFHDTRGMALANILTSLEQSIRIFDSSIGGLGGCPYAEGSSGNVATEEVAWLLEGFGFDLGIDIQKLLGISQWIEAKIQRTLKAKLYLSRPKRLYYDH